MDVNKERIMDGLNIAYTVLFAVVISAVTIAYIALIKSSNKDKE